MKGNISILIFITVFLTSCAPSTASPATVTPIIDKPVVTETLTETPSATLTNTPTIIPTLTEIAYFDLSPDARLEKSANYVKQATSYSGPVSFTYTSQERQAYQFYWNPTANSWDTLDTLSPGGVPESSLDINGESLLPNAAKGFENPDGSLVLVHPLTGEQLTFPATVPVPGRGEVPIRELMAMNPVDLNNQIIEFTLSAIGDDQEDELWKIQNGMRTSDGYQVRGIAYPAFVIGNSDFFPTSLAISDRDLPELHIGIDEIHTDLLAVPIFSPETGDFMFWGIFQGGHVASVAEFVDEGNGNTSYDFIRFSSGAFGSNGSGFGIFMEYKDPSLTYYRGGFDRVIFGDQPGMGDVSNIQTILNATTEEQILNAFAQDSLIWSVPSAVAYSSDQ